MFGQNRESLRRVYLDAWEKFKQAQPLEPLEQMIVQVIEQHPEYHGLLEHTEQALQRDYTPEDGQSNPFLHMGMHLAIHEQLQTARPSGIVEAYQALMETLQDAHQVEHQIMECLGEMIWSAQRQGSAPDEQAYLGCIRQRAGRLR